MHNFAPLPLQSEADYDQNLAEEITLLAGQINAANYRLLKLIATFDDSLLCRLAEPEMWHCPGGGSRESAGGPLPEDFAPD